MSNFEYLDRLTEERNRSWARAQEIMNRAYDEKRELSPEERVELDRHESVIVGTKDEAQRTLRMAEAMRTADAFRVDMEPRVEAARSEKRDATDTEMLFEMFRGERRAFESRASGRIETRALQSAGGSAIPESFYDRVTVYERTLVPVLDVATVLNTKTGNPITLPRLTADIAYGGTVVAEAANFSLLDPTISAVTLNAFKYGAITVWSKELDQDEVIGLEDLVAESTARELSIDIGAHLTTGTATTQPNGFINAGTNLGTAGGTATGQASDTFFSATDLIQKLYYGLAAPYRRNAVWMASTTACSKMRTFRDSTGNFIWQPGGLRAEGGVDLFLNRPVYENPAMAAVASATKSVAFGDFKRYYIRRLPMRVELSNEYAYASDQIAIKVVERLDGNLVDTAAVGYLVSANT